jgi:glycosyltransferase involved in cell wall biosynthesis
LVNKDKILVVYSYRASFVAKDIAILSKQYIVEEYHFNVDNKLLLPVEFIKQFFYLLFSIKKYKYINSQLVGYFTVLPVLFGRLFKVKTVLLVGGAECFSFPSIHYGNLRKPLLKWATKIALKNADLLIPVHESLIQQDLSYYPVDYPQQGYKYFFPQINTKVQSIYNGYDTDKWKPTGEPRVANSFITVALGLDKQRTILRKGIDLIEEAAVAFPHCTFTIIGVPQNSTIGQGLPNVTVYSKVPNAELPAMLSQNEFYFQLSVAEGFPNALAEAMACGCVPIVSNVSAMPHMIANAGFVLQHRNTAELMTLINQALLCDKTTLSTLARKRVEDNYSELQREEALFKAFNTL